MPHLQFEINKKVSNDTKEEFVKRLEMHLVKLWIQEQTI